MNALPYLAQLAIRQSRANRPDRRLRWKETLMGIKVVNITIDCRDMDTVSRFWSELLGARVTTRADGWIELEHLGADGPALSFQRIPEVKEAPKNRLHFDLAVADPDEAAARAADLGAVPAKDVFDGTTHQVWRDPEGNEFCLVPA